MMKASIRNIVLGGVLAGLTAAISVAKAAEPAEAIDVHQAPGVDLPPQLAADVRAAIEDVLAGRAHPAVPIDVTLDAGGAVVRVGSLSRRIAIVGWDYPAMRTVALNVLDLLQPGPEVPEVSETAAAAASPMPAAAPAAGVVEEVRVTGRPSAQTAEFEGPLSVHLALGGARGAQGPDPWMVSGTVGAAWTRNWLRIGLEVGWDHGIVRHPATETSVGVTVNYDATPLRLVLAVQNRVVMAGVRAGVAVYRLRTEETYTKVTPLVGPFLAAKFPIAGRFRGMLMGGFDYFARRTELTTLLTLNTAYSSPQLAPYVAVVAEVVLAP
jgi:hypothetical protein